MASLGWYFVLGYPESPEVDSFNQRDLCLLTDVKNDSSLITSQRDSVCPEYAFSASWQVI